MTDKEELIALLTRWGVRFEEEQCSFSGDHCVGREHVITVRQRDVETEYPENYYDLDGDEQWRIYQRAEKSVKEIGYSGFYTSFFFADDGSFTAMGAWE